MEFSCLFHEAEGEALKPCSRTSRVDHAMRDSEDLEVFVRICMGQ